MTIGTQLNLTAASDMAKIQFQHPARVVCFAVGAKGGEALHALDDSVSTPTGQPICVCRDCHVRILCNRFHRSRVAVLSGVPTLPRNDLYINRSTSHQACQGLPVARQDADHGVQADQGSREKLAQTARTKSVAKSHRWFKFTDGDEVLPIVKDETQTAA